VHALEAVRGRLGDLHAGADGPGDRHHLRRVVLHERPARVAVATDHVEHAGGQELGGISASITYVAGVVSEGLSTTVLPAAMAGANFHTAIIIG
jgi:hypothetical protein